MHYSACPIRVIFLKLRTHTENERLFHPVEATRQGEFDFGADLSKKEDFSSKKCSDRAQVHLFAVSICQNHIISNDCCGTPFCAETALVCHRSASNFLTYFLLVARLLLFLCRHIHTVFIENFLFICNYVATLKLNFEAL